MMPPARGRCRGRGRSDAGDVGGGDRGDGGRGCGSGRDAGTAGAAPGAADPRRGHVDGRRALARRPHRGDRSARRAVDLRGRRRAGPAHPRGRLRRPAAGLVARRPAGWRSRRITATPGTCGSSTPTAAACSRSPSARSTIASRSGRPTAPGWRSRRIAAASTTSGSPRSPAARSRRLTTRSAPTSRCRRGRPTAARSPSSPTASRAGSTPQPVSGGAERRLVEDPSAVAAPAWAPDGNSVAYTTIDGAVARLIVGGKNIAEPTEDLFPFRPQFVAGGDLALHGRRGGEAAAGRRRCRPSAAVHRGDRLHPGAVHAEGPALRRGRPAAGARPDAPGNLARRRPHRLCRARRRVAPRRRRGRECRARAPDPGRLRRDQPGVVARRPGTRLLVGSRRRGRLVDSRSADRPRSPRRRQRHHRVVVARRRPARLPRHRIDAAGRRRGVARRAPGARSDLRARASELVARRPGRGDVGAAALFFALPRGHQPGAVGRRRARDHGGGEGRVPRRSLVRPGAAPVGGHARELRPGLGAQRPGDGGHRRRLADDLPGVPRRHADRAAAAGQRGPGQLAVVDRRFAPDPLPGRRSLPPGDAGRRQCARHHAGVVVDAAPHHRHDDGPRRAAVRRPRAERPHRRRHRRSTAPGSPRWRRIATICTAAPSSTRRPGPSCPA